jgi:uncharacterized protein (DUF433 family)
METDVINIDSEVLSGSPVFVGTRVPPSGRRLSVSDPTT